MARIKASTFTNRPEDQCPQCGRIGLMVETEDEFLTWLPCGCLCISSASQTAWEAVWDLDDITEHSIPLFASLSITNANLA